jgi:proteasome lid subunit RPN8/RPN11
VTLVLSPELRRRVERAAEQAFPEECCGFLIGRVPDAFDRPGRRVVVHEARALPNGWEAASGAPGKTTRYRIDPRLFMKVERELEGSGRAIVGLYHSHPSVPAWPSPFDLQQALPCLSYWIVCVREGRSQESRSWMRSEDGGSFLEEPVEMTTEAVSQESAP